MISLFVKVDGKLQRYESECNTYEAYYLMDTLRETVRGALPARVTTLSPVLGLIDNIIKREYEQIPLQF